MFNMFQFATNNVFESKFKVHSMAIKGSVELDDGGKILLPPSALDFLSRLQISWPVFFHVRNPAGGRSTHCGVQEFTAEEGTCNMPYWMMQQLGFKEGSIAIIRQTNMARGTFAKIQPHSKDFLDISNPRAVLEKHLRDYSCMTKGDVFQFTYANKKYAFNVLEVRPGNAVSLIETDMNVEFAPPLDYVEPERPAAAVQAAQQPQVVGGALEPDVHVVPNTEMALRSSATDLSTGGVRLDGKRPKTDGTPAAGAQPPPLRTRLTLGTPAMPHAAPEAAKPAAAPAPAPAPAAAAAAAAPATSAKGAAAAPASGDDYWAKLGGGNSLKPKKK